MFSCLNNIRENLQRTRRCSRPFYHIFFIQRVCHCQVHGEDISVRKRRNYPRAKGDRIKYWHELAVFCIVKLTASCVIRGSQDNWSLWCKDDLVLRTNNFVACYCVWPEYSAVTRRVAWGCGQVYDGLTCCIETSEENSCQLIHGRFVPDKDRWVVFIVPHTFYYVVVNSIERCIRHKSRSEGPSTSQTWCAVHTWYRNIGQGVVFVEWGVVRLNIHLDPTECCCSKEALFSWDAELLSKTVRSWTWLRWWKGPAPPIIERLHWVCMPDTGVQYDSRGDWWESKRYVDVSIRYVRPAAACDELHCLRSGVGCVCERELRHNRAIWVVDFFHHEWSKVICRKDNCCCKAPKYQEKAWSIEQYLNRWIRSETEVVEEFEGKATQHEAYDHDNDQLNIVPHNLLCVCNPEIIVHVGTAAHIPCVKHWHLEGFCAIHLECQNWPVLLKEFHLGQES